MSQCQREVDTCVQDAPVVLCRRSSSSPDTVPLGSSLADLLALPSKRPRREHSPAQLEAREVIAAECRQVGGHRGQQSSGQVPQGCAEMHSSIICPCDLLQTELSCTC